ncbi:hypothetical protein EVAR_60789_1 [Eumeta japonica]|uniref:Uncharacterized protein n=1 Tax=Eumeta variegata TaxID=151549 RepID=A0A4C2A0L8_EUMVA|nr:hypothetical protein EVAR_60789_1 [Eumeta japonica]
MVDPDVDQVINPSGRPPHATTSILWSPFQKLSGSMAACIKLRHLFIIPRVELTACYRVDSDSKYSTLDAKCNVGKREKLILEYPSPEVTITVDALYSSHIISLGVVLMSVETNLCFIARYFQSDSRDGLDRNLKHSKRKLSDFSVKKSPLSLPPFVGNTNLSGISSIGILDVYISKSVKFRDYLERKVKLASKKLGVLDRQRWYFLPDRRVHINSRL